METVAVHLICPCKTVSELRRRLEEHCADEWDRQIEADIKAGLFDRFAAIILDNLHTGRCTDQ